MSATHREMRGFEYLVYSAFSAVLLVVLLLLPLAPAFASETVPDESPQVVTSAPPSVPETVDVSTPDVEAAEPLLSESEELPNTPLDEPIIEAPPAEDLIAVAAPEAPIEEEITEIIAQPEPLIANSESTQSTETAVVPDAPEQAQTSDTGVTQEAELPPSDLPTDEVVPTTESVVVPEEVVEEPAPEVAEVTAPITESVEPALLQPTQPVAVDAVTNDDNRFTFSKSQCTAVGDGTFYCAQADASTEVSHTDRIFSAPDAEGDKEIYIERDSEITVLTDNVEDDDAPYFDEVSNTLVWHRLIEGRYQIMSYDFDTEEETQITFDRYNNMQPHRFDGATVWQGWVGNDWEVFLLEGDTLTMLTDNATHDITPSINGTHVVWQSFENDAWRMKVYDIRTKIVETIEDAGGGSIENPRFVLVYDTKFASGDVETRGYDLQSGEVIALGSEPAPVPQEIPNPDQTGEERALVSPSTQPKSKVAGEEDSEPQGGDAPPVPEGDVVVPPFTPDIELASSTESIPLEVDAVDLIVPGLDTASSTDVSHIEDLIITPFVEPIESPLDSQGEVASST